MAAKAKSTRNTRSNLEKENAELREKLERQATTTQALHQELSKFVPSTNRAAELMVGIRNISDNTIGIGSKFLRGEREINLDGAVGPEGPGQVAVVSYAAWQELRKSKFVADGLIMRDDSVLSEAYTAAPKDRPSDIAATWAVNAIIDPHAWIEARNEQQIREDIGKITAMPAIRRLQRAVNDKLRVLQVESKETDSVVRAQKALDELPTKYSLVDQLTANRT